MTATYKDIIKEKVTKVLEHLGLKIDLCGQFSVPLPNIASSEFLTNKEQGDWAEKLVVTAINESSLGLLAVPYGCSESLAAGEEGFEEFFEHYQADLNENGKRPDILIFEQAQFPTDVPDTSKDDVVRKAIAGIEVRSSSFLADRYALYMKNQEAKALATCMEITKKIMANCVLSDLLRRKRKKLYEFLKHADEESFKELDFRAPSWSSSDELRQLSNNLAELKKQIASLHKRRYLSITPKIEDIALVNRWIQRFGVKHYYLQVFFDKAYLISFEKILDIVLDSHNEGELFSIERDVKNQRKTTIKINVEAGREVIGKIEMPDHRSRMKELQRGRLLFYVTFEGGRGYIDTVLLKEVLGVP